MYRPFRASWQTVIRPFTSFPLPPLKFRTVGFPQYGFKPASGNGHLRVRRRARLEAVTVGISFPGVLSVVGLATNRHRELLTTTAGPVALGSPAGCIVRPARRLLWPHLRL